MPSDYQLYIVVIEELHGLIATVKVRARSHLIGQPVLVIFIKRIAP